MGVGKGKTRRLQPTSDMKVGVEERLKPRFNLGNLVRIKAWNDDGGWEINQIIYSKETNSYQYCIRHISPRSRSGPYNEDEIVFTGKGRADPDCLNNLHKTVTYRYLPAKWALNFSHLKKLGGQKARIVGLRYGHNNDGECIFSSLRFHDASKDVNQEIRNCGFTEGEDFEIGLHVVDLKGLVKGLDKPVW